jgi:hypothetical protein
MDPLSVTGGAASRAFSFDSAWMWPIVITAAVFVGYLCLDALRSYRHDKWFKRRKEEARRNRTTIEPGSDVEARQQKALAEREHNQGR